MTAVEKTFTAALGALNAKDFSEAEKLLRKVLRLDAKHVAALNLLTIVLMSGGRFAEAEAFIARAVSLNQNSDVSFYNYGVICKHLDKPALAVEQFGKALRLNPNVPETWSNRGTAYNDLRDYEAALSDFDNAIALNAGYAEAYVNKGKALYELRRYEQASAVYRSALALRPQLAEAWLGLGNALVGRRHFDDAIIAYDKATALRPDLIEAWLNLGHALDKLKKHRDALGAFERARGLKPDFKFIKGVILHQKMLCCDWTDLSQQVAEIEQDLRAGKKSAEPFGWQGLATSDESLQICAQLWNSDRYPSKSLSNIEASALAYEHRGRIRIGYLAGEFRDQATSHLLAGVLEAHDKDQFEIVALDNGWDDGSDLRKRLDKAFDRFIDIRPLTDDQAARRIRDEKVDILINLNGYFGEERTGVFACRPAPVQVNYLGFPGTIGANYIDYIIADRWVVPQDKRQYFNEKVVWLPDTYQANDRSRRVADVKLSRGEFDLPERAFVFCCFNNAYKITPQTFDSWMRILAKVDRSVLWLLADNPLAEANLRKEAVARGVDGARLIFARRVTPAEHLARHRLADLFLDTLPYNAHTTASDALWAGIPLLTQLGNTFAGRVAASLLNAIGLQELVTHSSTEYEMLAINLALNHEMLEAVKDKLAKNRLTTPLFDTMRFTKHIEQAYRIMHERNRAGLPPDHIEVAL